MNKFKEFTVRCSPTEINDTAYPGLWNIELESVGWSGVTDVYLGIASALVINADGSIKIIVKI